MYITLIMVRRSLRRLNNVFYIHVVTTQPVGTEAVRYCSDQIYENVDKGEEHYVRYGSAYTLFTFCFLVAKFCG